MNIFFRCKHKKRSMKKSFLINFCKIHRKTLVPVFFLLKKRLWHRRFPVDFAKFLKKPFLQNSSRRLLLTLLLRPFGNTELSQISRSNEYQELLGIWLCPHSGSPSFRQVSPIHKKKPWSFLKFFYHFWFVIHQIPISNLVYSSILRALSGVKKYFKKVKYWKSVLWIKNRTSIHSIFEVLKNSFLFLLSLI